MAIMLAKTYQALKAAGAPEAVAIAGADADRVERRIHAGAADRKAARGRSAAQGVERSARPAAGSVAPTVLSDSLRDGRLLPGDEPGLRAPLRGQRGGGGDAGH